MLYGSQITIKLTDVPLFASDAKPCGTAQGPKSTYSMSILLNTCLQALHGWASHV